METYEIIKEISKNLYNLFQLQLDKELDSFPCFDNEEYTPTEIIEIVINKCFDYLSDLEDEEINEVLKMIIEKVEEL